MPKGEPGLYVEYCAKDFLDGTLQLGPMEELAYRRICDMIYATNDRLADDDQKLAWSTKTGKRWAAIKKSLTTGDKPKLIVVGGRLTNARCQSALAIANQKMIRASIGGTASAETGKSLKNLKQHRTSVRSDVREDARGEARDDARTNQVSIEPLVTSEPNGSSGIDASAREIAVEMARTWRSECGDILPVPNKLDRERVASLNRRFRDTFHRNLEEWRAYCQAIRAAPFCCGESKDGWQATLNWALRPKSITAIQEGNYVGTKRKPKQSATDNLVQGFGWAAGLGREEVDCGADREVADPLLDPGHEPRGPGGSGAGLDRRPAGVWGSDRGGSLPRIPPHAEPPADPGGYSETLH